MHHHHPLPPALRPLPPLLLALAGAALCAAADGPQIERVLDGRGKETRVVSPSRSFEVRGQNLYVPPADPEAKGFPGLSATLAGVPLKVNDASPTSLWFHVSADQPLRKNQTLVIRVGTKSVRAKLDVALTDQGRDGDEKDTDRPPPPLPFKITSFTYASTGAGSTFSGAGVVPDAVEGMKLTLTLRFGEQVLRTRIVKIKQARFKVTFGPFRERVPVGFYSLALDFSLNSQRRSQVRGLTETLKASSKGGATLASYKSVQRRAFVGVGGSGPGGQLLPADRAPQEARLRQHVTQAADATEAALKELEAALALAGRVYFKRPGQPFEEARYLQWLVDEGHAQDSAQAQRLLADSRFASRGGELDAAAWATWVEEQVFRGVRARLAEAKAFAGETLCPLDLKADALFERAQAELLGIARSQALFKRAGQPLPRALQNPPQLKLRPASGASPKRLRATLSLLRKRVGAQ